MWDERPLESITRTLRLMWILARSPLKSAWQVNEARRATMGNPYVASTNDLATG